MKLKMLLGAVVMIWGIFLSPAAGAGSHQVVHGRGPKLVTRLQDTGELPKKQRLNIVIGLPLRNQRALAAFLQQLYDQNSPQYHKFLTPDQFAEKFGPSESDYQAVIAFAKAAGLAVTHTHRNRTLLDVSGTVADIEKVFHVTLRVYHHPTESRTFYAPDAEPSVALDVPLLSVGGLNNYLLPRPMNHKAPAFARPAGAQPQAGSGPGGNYIGNDFRAAYVPGVALTGSGQTVGLLEFDGYSANDIVAYESLAGLPAMPLTNILLDGFDGSAGGNSDEVSLDIEMAISMAPGLAGVVVYEEPNNGTSVNDILNEMAVPSHGEPLSLQLSASWTYPIDANTEQIFQQFAAQGQSFFNASGDDDAYVTVVGGQLPTPVSDTNITIVGGTTLTTSGPGGSWQSETAWNWGSRGPFLPDIGTGGGITLSGIPVWQQGIDMLANHGSITLRNIPDVALTADNIWVIYGHGQVGEFGGTSCATPLWAAFMALANQQAAAYGRPPMGFINPAIYALAKGPFYDACFHDITTGNNTNSASPNLYYAVPGYDLCTGWGTPNGANLINALAPPDWLEIIPSSAFISSGNPGGPFTVTSQSLTLTNLGTSPLAWSLSNTAPWLDVSASGGTLTPGGDQASVAVSLNPAAGNLSPGTYLATLWFTNLDDSVGQGYTFTLNVLGAARITAQPQDQLVNAGDNAIFTFSISGATPLNYCWQQNGISVPGATNATCSAKDMQLSDSGSQFSCVVTNVFGSITSSVAALTVVIPPLWSFAITNGANPNASLVQGADGNLYGTTVQGGPNDEGTVFKITPGGTLTTLVTFNFDNGAYPFSGLVQGADGNLYGTTGGGGTYSAGTVFRMTTAGTLTTLASFDSSVSGAGPVGTLVQGTDGNLYGTTEFGGSNGLGSMFTLTTNGVLTTLVWFNQTNGAYPFARLVQGSNGNFYGTTSRGGAYDEGTVFKITTDGVLTTLVAFNNTDGANPLGGLVQGSDGNFYGTTVNGAGSNYLGTVFKMIPDGLLTTLASFNETSLTNGSGPGGDLMQDGDGYFYGTTIFGGTFGDGTLFRMTSDGRLTNLYAFAGVNGANPSDAVVQGNDGNLYGTTSAGGIYGYGTVFRLPVTSQPVIVVPPRNQTVAAGDTASFSVSATGNAPLNYQWQFLGTNIPGANYAHYILAGAAMTDAGGYTVVVANDYGSVTSRVAILTLLPVPAVGTYGSQLVVFFPILPGISFAGFGLQMTSDPASGNWVTLTNGIPFSGLQITDPPGTAFFRLDLAAQTVTRIAGGGDHSLFLKRDGSLWAMGNNQVGQLGDGTWSNASQPEQIMASNVTAVAAGFYHSLFLKRDGSLWGMGYNSSGQLGDGAYSNVQWPEMIVSSNVMAVVAGSDHNLFLKSDGSLWGMGINYDGELGNGLYNYTNLPVQIVAGNVTAIAAGGGHSLFLKSDGSLWAMGFNQFGQLGDGTYSNRYQPREIMAGGVTAIAAGGDHSLFLKSDGSLWAMGFNRFGQLGDGTTNSTNLPEQIMASNVTAIAAGGVHSLFLKTDGSLWAMGNNQEGQLGDGTYNNSRWPELILASNVTAVVAGSDHSLFLESDGSLWAMGYNYDGELGDGIYSNFYPPYGTNQPEQSVATPILPTPVLGLGTYGNQPVVLFPSVAAPINCGLLMTTNLVPANWVTVSNTIPFTGLQITNAPSPAFFRLH